MGNTQLGEARSISPMSDLVQGAPGDLFSISQSTHLEKMQNIPRYFKVHYSKVHHPPRRGCMRFT